MLDICAEIFFTIGDTQTNAVVISATLKSYEGVIAADSGHISIHEAGAIQPCMVYISQPTEYGTLYTRAELNALADLASLYDAFYIGGTKGGAYFGEAIVLRKNFIPKFFYDTQTTRRTLGKGQDPWRAIRY